MLVCAAFLHECGQAMFSSILEHVDRELVGWLCPSLPQIQDKESFISNILERNYIAFEDIINIFLSNKFAL